MHFLFAMDGLFNYRFWCPSPKQDMQLA